MAAWKKSSPKLVEAFAAALPDDPRVERRSMFGYPCAFTGGNMFAGLHEERLVVRLGEKERAMLRALPGALPFEPMGRPMKEYTVVPPAMHVKPAELRRWLARALEYVAALPPKPKGKAKGEGKAKAKASAGAKAKAKKVVAAPKGRPLPKPKPRPSRG